MENHFLTRKAKGEKILFSELLANPPSDEVLAELFPYKRKNAPFITQIGLEILKLRLEGLNNSEVAGRLSLTQNQVAGRFQTIRINLLSKPIPDDIEIDPPALRRQRDMEILITTGYTRVSELLRDMPSDQELWAFSVMRGNVPSFGSRRPLNNNDLSILQKKAAGRRDADIARELGVRRDIVRRRLVWIRDVLRTKLGVRIDMPELFPHEADLDRKVVWRYAD